jgi:hypothetical protein
MQTLLPNIGERIVRGLQSNSSSWCLTRRRLKPTKYARAFTCGRLVDNLAQLPQQLEKMGLVRQISGIS